MFGKNKLSSSKMQKYIDKTRDKVKFNKIDENKITFVTGRYSFTVPEEKHIFSDVTRAWHAVYFLTFLTISGYALFLIYSTDMMEEKRNEFVAEKVKLTEAMNEQSRKLKIFKKRDSIVGTVMDSNASLQDSIIRFFNLVPKQILLTDMLIEKDSLVLKGITPSIEIYKNLLEAPLKSIFNVTKVDFYKTLNTWTNFVSVNKKEDRVERLHDQKNGDNQ